MEVNLKHSLIFLRPDDIIQVNCSDHTYKVKDIKDIVETQGKVAGGQKKRLLIIAHEFTNIESDAREFMARDENTIYSIAEAYVIKSLGQRILANFYLRVNKPSVPSMFFTDVNSAERWLKNIK